MKRKLEEVDDGSPPPPSLGRWRLDCWRLGRWRQERPGLFGELELRVSETGWGIGDGSVVNEIMIKIHHHLCCFVDVMGEI